MQIQYYKIRVVYGGDKGPAPLSYGSKPYLVTSHQDDLHDDDELGLHTFDGYYEIPQPFIDDGDHFTIYATDQHGKPLTELLEKIKAPEYGPIIQQAMTMIKKHNRLTINKVPTYSRMIQDGVSKDFIIPYIYADNSNEVMSINVTQYMLAISGVKVYKLVNLCYMPIPDEDNTITVYFMNCVDMPIMVSRIGFNCDGVRIISQSGNVVSIIPDGGDEPLLSLCAKINATIGVYRTLINGETSNMFNNCVNGIPHSYMEQSQAMSKDLALSYGANTKGLIDGVFMPLMR